MRLLRSVMLVILLICTACVPLPPRAMYESEIIFETANYWYVDSAASGTNAGTSWTNAWESFADINWTSVADGDTIYISGGSSGKTYTDTLTVPGGESNLTITKGIDAGHTGTVTFSAGTGISLSARSTAITNLTISNFTFSNSSRGIYGDGAGAGGMRGLTIDNCQFDDFRRAGIFLEGNNYAANNYNIIVKNSSFDDSDSCDVGQSDGIYIQVLSDFTAENNYILLDNNCTETADLHSDNIQAFWVEDVTYKGNTVIQRSDKTKGTQMLFTENAYDGHHIIMNNVIVRDAPNATDAAIRLKSGSGSSFTGTIVGNSFIGNGRIINSSVASTIKNNAFYGLSSTATTEDFAVYGSGSTVSNNIFYDPDGAYPAESGGTDVDPLFVSDDPADPNLMLGVGSPAIDAGTALDAAYAVDIDGVTRPQGSAWDIGAYEDTSGGTTPTPTYTPTVTNTPATGTPTATNTPTNTPTPVTPSAGGVWYVDNSATGGANNGTSWANAWTSFASIVWASVAAGDTIYISGGSTSKTYYETLSVGKSGTSLSAMINIQPGANSASPSGHSGTVIIDGGGARSTGIYSSGKSHVHINGLSGADRKILVQNATSAGININNASYVYVDYVEVINAASRGIFEEESDHVRIKGCYVHTGNSTSTSQTDGIYMQVGTDNTVENSIVVLGTSNSSAHMDCLQTVQEDRLTVRNSWFEWAAGRGNLYSQVIISEDFSDWQYYYNNVTIGNEYNPLAFYLKEADPGGIAYVWNNTAIGNYSGANASAFCSKLTNDETGAIKNNILVSTVANNVPMRLTQSGLTTSKVDYNLLYAADSSVAEITGSERTWAQYQALGFDANGINDDPDLDEASEYRLEGTSPAINAGTSISAYFTTDKDGVTRPVGAAWDMGAYEYDSGAPAPTSTPTSVGTNTPTPVATRTPTHTPTGVSPATSTPTPTRTATPTATTASGATSTSTPRATNTPTTAPALTSTPTHTPVPTPAAGLFINEVSPTDLYDWNLDGSVTAADRWVELYNAGAAAVNLAGYTISDGTFTGTVRVWGMTIGASGGRRVILGEDFTTFPASGTLTLRNALATPVATVVYNAQTDGLCYARVPSGSTTWLNNQVCTPGE